MFRLNISKGSKKDNKNALSTVLKQISGAEFMNTKLPTNFGLSKVCLLLVPPAQQAPPPFNN